MSFWRDLPQPFFILAPMEAVTDVIFRHVVEEAGAPDLYFTEFTNATGWVHAGSKAISGRLIKTEDETKLVAQLWGAIPEDMTQLATHCRELGYLGVDINMGCPDSSAVKTGGGAAMCRTPELAGKMIAAAKASGLPTSVKCRLGYSRIDEWREWISFLLQQDIENLTIHLRTKKEMSKVPAHFELIPEIIKLRDEVAPDTLLTINGDIEDRVQGLKLIEENPGINGIMIGRGVFHNPFCFRKLASSPPSSSRTASRPTSLVYATGSVGAADVLEDEMASGSGDITQARVAQGGAVPSSTKGDEEATIKKQQLLNLLKLQLDLYDQYSHQTRRPFETLKRFFKIYVNSFEGAAELRDKLMHTKSTDDVRALLDLHS